MPPIYSFQCAHCQTEFDSLIMPWEHLHAGVQCPVCRTQGAVRMPTAPGSYEIKGDNSASTRPKSR